ncbi:hypothetical protein ACIQLG_00735 [Terribacillus saccharophilus]|uniref:hypothetical protein n=1 Tax=Terribacillus saccharophilus TaxID=361277 RepID=UPI0038249E8A
MYMYNSNIITLVEVMHEYYKQNIDKLFKKAHESTPEAFRFYNLNNIKLHTVELDPELFSSNLILFVEFKKDGKLEIDNHSFLDSRYYEDYADYHEYTFKTEILSRNGIVDQRDIIFDDNIFYLEDSWDEDNGVFKYNLIKTFKTSLFNQMQSFASQEARTYQKHINHNAGYYAKNAHKYAYSILDLGPMIEKVNDDDFEYQLNQALAAYDHSLYMASCACLGVCLETLCKILLKKNNVKVKDSDATMLDKLAERLRAEQIISRKFNSRLDVCYKVRNLSSHTSPGIVIREDCHTIIGTMHEIVNTYFD